MKANNHNDSDCYFLPDCLLCPEKYKCIYEEIKTVKAKLEEAETGKACAKCD